MAKINVTQTHAASFRTFALDHDAIRRLLRERRTFVADAQTLRGLATNVANVIGVDSEFVIALLKLEVGYPDDYEIYRSTMRGGSGNIYVGVTQMYNAFWTDVRGHYKYSSELPSRKEDTTLEMQLVAPFLYAERYRDGLIRQGYPFSPAVIYAAHQQGGPTVGLNSFGASPIAGKQSGSSVRVVNEVKRYNRTKEPMRDVWL